MHLFQDDRKEEELTRTLHARHSSISVCRMSTFCLIYSIVNRSESSLLLTMFTDKRCKATSLPDHENGSIVASPLVTPHRSVSILRSIWVIFVGMVSTLTLQNTYFSVGYAQK